MRDSIPVEAIKIDFAEVLRETFIGAPTDAEASKLVKRTFFIPRDMETLMNNIVQDPRTEYKSFDDFVRHGVIALLDGYYAYGYPDAELGQELSYIKMLRTQAHRAQRRAELRELSHVFDEELDIARLQGDWKYILEHLEQREKNIEDAPSELFAHSLMLEAARSSSLRNAVGALARWATAEENKEVIRVVEKWSRNFEQWS